MVDDVSRCGLCRLWGVGQRACVSEAKGCVVLSGLVLVVVVVTALSYTCTTHYAKLKTPSSNTGTAVKHPLTYSCTPLLVAASQQSSKHTRVTMADSTGIDGRSSPAEMEAPYESSTPVRTGINPQAVDNVMFSDVRHRPIDFR